MIPWISVLVLILTLGALPAPPSHAASAAEIAKNLAENVLGRQTVKSIRAVDNGARLVMIWDSPTFKSSNSRQYTRELLEAEVQLTSSAIFGVLREVRRIQFSIVTSRRHLAAGETSRESPMQLIFAPDLRD